MVTEKINLKGMPLSELETFFTERGEERFRARQVMSWIYKRRVYSFQQMTDLPKGLREKLTQVCYISELKLIDKQVSSLDGTTKYFFELEDGNRIESVLLPHEKRVTVCISVQIGCPYRCRFCATGLSGFIRSLTAGEIVDQILAIQTDLGSSLNIRNVVVMGMGEPFANYEEIMKAVRLINSPQGLHIGARKITISTVGLIPGIRRLAEENLQVGLAVSLHATTDGVRNKLIPINRKYPLGELIKECKLYTEKTGRRVTFEYLLIKDVNDSPDEARHLGKLLKGLLCNVNLIPLNPVEGIKFTRSSEERIGEFWKILQSEGIACVVRREKGTDIDAACGQLRARREPF